MPTPDTLLERGNGTPQQKIQKRLKGVFNALGQVLSFIFTVAFSCF
jgi:hypothetical protein